MAYINEIVGLTFLALGVITVIISLVAFVVTVFRRRKRKAVKDWTALLREVNALIKNWTSLLDRLPRNIRHVFVLLPFGFILIGLGVYILAKHPF
jgi:hypothetical protein